MNGSQVAAALAQLADRRQEFDQPLKECLSKFLKSNLLKTPSLELLQTLPQAAGKEFSLWLVQYLAPADLDKALKKIDPLAFRGLTSSASKQAHATDLMFGRIVPLQEPTKTARKGQPVMAAEDVLRLSDRNHQRAELERFSAAQLKKAIKEHGIYGGALSNKPSKVELVEHILAALDAGWPRPTSILERSRY